MNSDIQNKRLNCQRCNEIAPSQPKEPLEKPPQPTRPFQLTVTDIFHMVGQKYLIYADRFSGFGGPAPAFVAPWIYEYIVNGLSSAL